MLISFLGSLGARSVSENKKRSVNSEKEREGRREVSYPKYLKPQ